MKAIIRFNVITNNIKTKERIKIIEVDNNELKHIIHTFCLISKRNGFSGIIHINSINCDRQTYYYNENITINCTKHISHNRWIKANLYKLPCGRKMYIFTDGTMVLKM